LGYLTFIIQHSVGMSNEPCECLQAIDGFGFFIDNQNLNGGSILQSVNLTSVAKDELNILFTFAQDIIFPPIYPARPMIILSVIETEEDFPVCSDAMDMVFSKIGSL
jgi:hypothetical protein